jgi:nucleoside 2-deoxyribosyltransferase
MPERDGTHRLRSRIYLAAPLFTHAEREYNLRIRAVLKNAFEVYLPQEDGELLVNLEEEGLPHAAAARLVFCADVEAIEGCDSLVAVLDGRTVDEGVAFEIGYAYSQGKPCYGLQTDPRRLMRGYNNPMLESALTHVFDSTSELEVWVRANRIAARALVPSVSPPQA